ncbi:S-adenosyl-L-methionine-dependent methyltransferase, partial [Athelia psychrophila]
MTFFTYDHYWVALLLLCFTALVYSHMKSTDPYGLFHLSLNKLLGEDPNADPTTEWLNMGYWQNTDVFPEACRALALKLIKVARIKPGGNVLDVGHGTGESLVLQLSSPDAPRPARLSGITSLKAHYQRSLNRVTRLHTETDVSLYHGDAIYRPNSQGSHPLDPSSTSEPFTAILALDCAYHFKTRKVFLEQSLRRLVPGGRVALADICFSQAALQSRFTRLLIRLCGLMPPVNVVSPEEYVECMKAIGYDGIEIEDISRNVFPGFSKFLRGRGWGWAVFGSVIGWWAQEGMLFVLISGARPDA